LLVAANSSDLLNRLISSTLEMLNMIYGNLLVKAAFTF